MMKLIPVLLILMVMSSCMRNNSDPSSWAPAFDGFGYRPVYHNPDDVVEIGSGPAQALVDPGKIYLLENYLFINERGRGIHVIDNTDPSDPKNISFISIPGNFDIAAKDYWLYADNYGDLLTFDISDPRNVKLTKRVENTIPVRDYPPHIDVYFECADPSKGPVESWEKIEMSTKPKCWR